VRVTEIDRRVSVGRRAGLDYGQRVRGSGELRRRTAHSGELHGLRRQAPATNGNGTSDERGVLEANSSRQEWGGSAVPFYREREGRKGSARGITWSSMATTASVSRRIMERREKRKQ
jgi:hypothetical protein